MFTCFCYATNSAWSVITFFGESVKGVFDKETNETYYVEVPRLPFKSYYPWNAMSGMTYMGTFAFQVNHNRPHEKLSRYKQFLGGFKRIHILIKLC